MSDFTLHRMPEGTTAHDAAGGLLVTLERLSPDQVRVRVYQGLSTKVGETRLDVVEAADLGGLPTPATTLIRYPKSTTHPAGERAPISWVNQDGVGLLRLISSDQVIVLPLLGPRRSEHQPVGDDHGARGPRRSADLWLAVAAWCHPDGFGPTELAALTGISKVTVHRWLGEAREIGIIDADPRARGGRYVVRASHAELFGTFVQQRWKAWRDGTGHPGLRPDYRYFTASSEWRVLDGMVRKAGLMCFPSGVTVLEGAASPQAWISPGGLLPELFLYASASDCTRLENVAALAVRRARERDDDSTLCVLADDHPALRLHRWLASREVRWPYGLAALDAMEHHDARVRQAAKTAWRSWIDAGPDGMRGSR